jgi:Flp pilus assembly protein TadB
MRSTIMLVGLSVLAASLVLGTPALAQSERERTSAERMERLEQQVQKLAERQEQFMQRVGQALEHRAQQPAGSLPEMQPMTPIPQGQGPQMPGKAAAKGLKDLIGLVMLIGAICNVIIAVWIFSDIRKRGEGSGSSFCWPCWPGSQRPSSMPWCGLGIACGNGRANLKA